MKPKSPAPKPVILRDILQYAHQFRARVFVVALDADLVQDESLASVLLDINILRNLSIPVVIIYGLEREGAPLATESGIAALGYEGIARIDAAALEQAAAQSHRLGGKLLEGLATNDLRAVIGNCVKATPLGIISGVDYQFTGKVERLDTDFIRALLDNHIVPIVPPIASDGEGGTYWLNADHAALELAKSLQAVKLVYLTGRNGVELGGALVRSVSADDLEAQYQAVKKQVPPDLASKIAHAILACRGGVPRVHIINGKLHEALLAEVFSNEGVGTMVYTNEYAFIRQAVRRDARDIYGLIKSGIMSEELVQRTRASIQKQINEFYVYEIDRTLVGCVALHLYPETQKGELACLYVRPDHENRGIGRKLIQYTLEQAARLKLSQVIALSTQTFAYFTQKAGFVEGTVDDLPAERREQYVQSGRNSKILKRNVS